MATLVSDEQNIQSGGGIVIGAVEILRPDAAHPPVIRSISRALIEKRFREQAANPAMVGKITPDPTPTLATVAPCEMCLENRRLGHSTLCAGCIADKSETADGSFLDREVKPREFLMMCFLAGLLIFCAIRFGAPNQSSEVEIHGRTTAAGSR